MVRYVSRQDLKELVTAPPVHRRNEYGTAIKSSLTMPLLHLREPGDRLPTCPTCCDTTRTMSRRLDPSSAHASDPYVARLGSAIWRCNSQTTAVGLQVDALDHYSIGIVRGRTNPLCPCTWSCFTSQAFCVVGCKEGDTFCRMAREPHRGRHGAANFLAVSKAEPLLLDTFSWTLEGGHANDLGFYYILLQTKEPAWKRLSRCLEGILCETFRMCSSPRFGRQ